MLENASLRKWHLSQDENVSKELRKKWDVPELSRQRDLPYEKKKIKEKNQRLLVD